MWLVCTGSKEVGSGPGEGSGDPNVVRSSPQVWSRVVFMSCVVVMVILVWSRVMVDL